MSPLSHPEVLTALKAARSVPAASEEVALPVIQAPDTAVSPPSPPTDAAPARPSAGATSSPAQASPASSLPRPGAAAGTLSDPSAGAAATPPPTAVAAPPPEPPPTSTSATTATTSKSKSRSKSRDSGKSSTTTTTTKKTTATTAPPPTKDQSQAQGQTRTISSKGGIVTVRWVDGRVEIRQARPNPGWELKVYNYGPDNVVVKFTRQRYTSWVWAGYRNGAPASAVMECAGSDRENCRPA